MTLPFERTRAVIYTEDFLQELLDPKRTPRVPIKIRKQAASLLRHYPSEFEMNVIAEREDKSNDFYKIFGSLECFTNEVKNEKSI